MERFDAKAYQQRVNERIPRSRTLQSCLRAFWTGGLICCVLLWYHHSPVW